MLQPDVLEEGWASAHLRRVVADLHTDTWMLVPGSEEVIAARTGTKPGDPTGDLLFTVLMTKVLRTLHDELRKEGLAFTVPPAGAVVARVRAARPGVAEIIDTSFVDDEAVFVIGQVIVVLGVVLAFALGVDGPNVVVAAGSVSLGD